MLDYTLLTKYGEQLDKNAVLTEYPRPQLKRDSYLNLNGEWAFAICDKEEPPCEFSEKIIVPFAVQSVLSGQQIQPNRKSFLVYKRTFFVEKGFIIDKTILHIDAADAVCKAYINGGFCGRHEGGYLPATFDVTKYIVEGENTITVIVKDETSYRYPTGKQRKKRGGIWYTEISGIWQTVWLESVSTDYIKNIKIAPNIDEATVEIEVETDAKEIELSIFDGNNCCKKVVTSSLKTVVKIDNPKLWAPEHPFLYTLKVNTEKDEIESYFAMRKFSVCGKTFLLNNEPYFINGVLDQGYFSDGIYTPADYLAYRDDIAEMKKLGFNALRKHIKIEPMMFYHYCDTLGMLVMQDMVNVGRYSFLRDSALPFIGFKKRLPWKTVNESQSKTFVRHAKETVQYLYNVPSVVYYTIFNEGWGQFGGDAEYEMLKALDKSRVYDATSGWFRQSKSDVSSEHIYFRPIVLKKDNKPIIVSEFGGYSYAIEGHRFNTGKSFGYRKYADAESLQDGFVRLYREEVLGNIKCDLAGAVYTQVSDVEDETNGLLTYDRKKVKLDEKIIAPLMKELVAEFEKRHCK